MERKPYSHRRIKVNKGDTYNDLTVIKEVARMNSKRMVLCECMCGEKTTVRLEYLRNNHTKSCGCKSVRELVRRVKTHGKTGCRLHGIWNGMKMRCYNENVKSYKHYGGKGVRVCEEWHSFEPFYKWAMANGYKEGLTIERVNPFGNYDPTNCTWIPRAEQGRNKRSNSDYKYA